MSATAIAQQQVVDRSCRPANVATVEKSTRDVCSFPIERIVACAANDTVSDAMRQHKFIARAPDERAALERAWHSANLPVLAERAAALQRIAADLAAEELQTAAAELCSVAHNDPKAARAALERTLGEIDGYADTAAECVGEFLASCVAR